MKVTQEEVVDRQAVLQIELESPEMEPFLERAYRRLVQRTIVHGFRKGKVPRSIFERLVGRDALVSDALEFLVPECMAQALQDQGLEAVGNPQVDIVQPDPVVLKATVPLRPLVDLGHYLEIRLEEEPVQVAEEEVQQSLEELRQTLAPWEPVDTPVQEDSLITMNIRADVDGRVLTNQREVPYLVRQDVDRPFPGFAQHLLGIGVQETKRFTATLPNDYEDQRAAGKEAHFTATVLEVKERRIPELDDEFAKGVGAGYDSLEALKEHLRQDLQAQKQRAADDRLQEAALEKALEGSGVEIPPLVVDHEVEHLLDDQARAIAQRDMDMETYLQSAGKTAEEMQAELREQAARNLKRAWVLVQIAKEGGLEVTPEEVDQEVTRLAMGSGQQARAVIEAFSNPGPRDSVAQVLLARKARERLARIARGQEVAQPSTSTAPQEQATQS